MCKRMKSDYNMRMMTMMVMTMIHRFLTNKYTNNGHESMHKLQIANELRSSLLASRSVRYLILLHRQIWSKYISG